jgi:hypothetical protein
MSAYANAHKKNLEIYFIYLGNNTTYCISLGKLHYLFYFPQKAIYFIILPFPVQIIWLS